MARVFSKVSFIAMFILPMWAIAQEVTDEEAEQMQKQLEEVKKELIDEGKVDKNGCKPLSDPAYDDFIALSESEAQRVLATEEARNSEFFGFEGSWNPEVTCYRFIDLAPGCGSERWFPKESNSEPGADEPVEDGQFGMVKMYDEIVTRVEQYPPLLSAVGKWSPQIQALHQRIQSASNKINEIIEGERSLEEKMNLLSPVFEDVVQTNRQIADAAKVNLGWSGGCGAADDDSQEVSFKITPKAKIARYILDYEFDRCARRVSDPYDLKKCDNWQVMRPKGNFLSGSYRYQVIWEDGTSQRDRLEFDSYQATPREIILQR